MQRGRPPGTATSPAPSKGTSLQPSSRAARAGYSAVRSGDDVKMALSTSSGRKPFASCSVRSSSAVASRIASLVFAVAVVAPRSPRRILAMALVDSLRLMVLTDAALLKGRDVVDVCRRAVTGGAGAHLGQDDAPLDALRPHVPPGFILGLSVGSRAEADRAAAWPADYWSVGPCFATATKPDAGAALGVEGFAALARTAPPGVPVIAIGGLTAGNAAAIVASGAVGIAVTAAVVGASDPAAAARALRAACGGPLESRPGAPDT